MIFKSKQDADHIQKFADIDAHLEGISALAMTATVTVGADIQTCVDKIYIFADSMGGCTYRDLKQMAGRPRNCREPVVDFCCPTYDPFKGAEPTFAETLQMVQTNQIDRRWHAARLALVSRLDFDGGKLVWATSAMLERLVWKIVEETTDFKLGFKRMCLRAGYKVVDTVEADAAAAAAAAAPEVAAVIAPAQVAAAATAIQLAETALELKVAAAAKREDHLAALLQSRDTLVRQFEQENGDRGAVLRGLEARVQGRCATADDFRLVDMGQALHRRLGF